MPKVRRRQLMAASADLKQIESKMLIMSKLKGAASNHCAEVRVPTTGGEPGRAWWGETARGWLALRSSTLSVLSAGDCLRERCAGRLMAPLPAA